MDDWSVSATAPAAASGEASNLAQSVTLTQARFFMDDIYLCQVSPFAQFIASRRLRNSSRLAVCAIHRVWAVAGEADAWEAVCRPAEGRL
jgi:hypothetical protein